MAADNRIACVYPVPFCSRMTKLSFEVYLHPPQRASSLCMFWVHLYCTFCAAVLAMKPIVVLSAVQAPPRDTVKGDRPHRLQGVPDALQGFVGSFLVAAHSALDVPVKPGSPRVKAMHAACILKNYPL